MSISPWYFGILSLLIAIPTTTQADPSPNCAALERSRNDAEHNDAKAQLILAEMYFKGVCVERSDQLGAKWLASSAHLGYAPAQGLMAIAFHETGNDDKAAEIGLLAANQGDANGQFLIASLFMDGKGVPRNDAEAVKWARLSAEQGNGGGQLALAQLYSQGRGLRQNYVEAERWFILANRTTYTSDSLIRAQHENESKLSRAEITEAERRANLWRPKSTSHVR